MWWLVCPRFCLCVSDFFFSYASVVPTLALCTHTEQPTEFCQYLARLPNSKSYLVAPHTPLHCINDKPVCVTDNNMSIHQNWAPTFLLAQLSADCLVQ